MVDAPITTATATSWCGDRVWVATFLNLLASSPVAVLKSEFSNDILLLSEGLMDVAFFGFEPKTMRDVL